MTRPFAEETTRGRRLAFWLGVVGVALASMLLAAWTWRKPLFVLAVDRGWPGALRALALLDAALTKLVDENGDSMLARRCVAGVESDAGTKTFLTLLDLGADPAVGARTLRVSGNLCSYFPEFAVKTGRLDLLEALLNHGADHNSAHWQSGGLFREAKSRDDWLRFLAVVKRTEADLNVGFGDSSPLIAVARSASTPRPILDMLRIGALPDFAAPDGTTPLHAAILNEWTFSPAVVDALVAAGADVNAQDARGFAPLHLIGDNQGSEDLRRAETLLRLGADPNLAAMVPSDNGEAHGRTPLHTAAIHASAEACLALIDAGADPNALDSNGETPLHYVVAWLAGSREGRRYHWGHAIWEPVDASSWRKLRWDYNALGLALSMIERGADPALPNVAGVVPADAILEAHDRMEREEAELTRRRAERDAAKAAKARGEG